MIDERFYRPAEVDALVGDASKAERVLGWQRKVDFKEMVETMVDSDLAAVAASHRADGGPLRKRRRRRPRSRLLGAPWHLPSPSDRPSPCSDASPSLAGVDLDVEEGTVARGARAERRGQDEPAAPARGARSPCAAGTGTVLGCDLATDARALRRRRSACSATDLSLYPELSAAENLAFAAPRGAARRSTAPRGALERVGLDGPARPRARRGRCRRASSAGWGWRGCSRAARRSGCSTSRTQDSTRRAARCATSSSRRRRAAGRPWSLTSHDADRAASKLADVVVDAWSAAPSPSVRAGGAGTPCGMTPCSSPARTCASSCARACCSGRSCPSASLALVLFALALGPSARGAAPRRAGAVLARRAPRVGARVVALRGASRRRQGTRSHGPAARPRPRWRLPRQGARPRPPAARARRGPRGRPPRALPRRRRPARGRDAALRSSPSRPSRPSARSTVPSWPGPTSRRRCSRCSSSPRSRPC